MKLLVFICLAISLKAQSLSLKLPQSVNRGSTATISVVLATPTGSPHPASLQFAIQYDARVFSGITATIGAAGEFAGKSVSCAGGLTGAYQCILAGGHANTIGDGVIAILGMRVNATTSQHNTSIALSNILGATVTAGELRLAAPARYRLRIQKGRTK